MRTIGLPNGYVVIVDDCDYNTVSPFKWSADVQRFADGRLRTVYARRNVLVDGRWTPQIMHRVISGAGPGQIVDHIDGDGLNNRRNNLRLCTTKENRRNMRPRVDGSSKFKGVSWNSARSKWSAHIKFGNKQKCLGQFMSEIDAARSYDAAAKEYFGDFARLNFGLTIPTVYENVEETNGVVYVYQG